LALAPRHHLYREQLTDLLWPEQDPRTSAGRLKQALHRARHALEPALPPYGASAYLRRQGDLVLLTAPGPLHIDVEAFQAAARAARRTQEPARYEAALALYRGALLPEDRFADWARGPREQLHALQCALLV